MQRAFTLIELLVVTVVLGMLAAFAIPRFTGLETQARKASLRTMEASLRSGAALAHSVWLEAGSKPDSVAVQGQTIAITYGYPDQSNVGRVLAGDTINATAVGRYAFTAGAGRSPSMFALNGSKAPAACRIEYVNAGAATAPRITVIDEGC